MGVVRPFSPSSRSGITLDVGLGLIAVTAVALALGHPAVAEVLVGVSILWFSVLVGARLARRLVDESDPTIVLILDLLLILVVICGLVGVGVMGVAIP